MAGKVDGLTADATNPDGDTAQLAPLLSDAAAAANGAQSGKAVHLALTDPDSHTVVPAASPRFKGDFLLDGQGDEQLIFAAKPGSRKQTLQVLSVSQPLDYTVFANTSTPSYLVTLNLTDGSLAPIKELAKIAPKRLLFTGPAGDSDRQDGQQ
ncbi:MAG TPA: hypothetical protein VIG41_13290 [Micrococcaceae bacterium]